jgi:site-specific DNA-methyltransferase (adenine-specific)
MITKGMFTSETDLWSTPQDLFDKLNSAFNFNLDVCATHENAKCKKYFTKKENGLKQKWKGNVWMNPPYGREIIKWVEKAFKESQKRM